MHVAFVLAIIFLICSNLVSGSHTALQRLGKMRAQEELKFIPKAFFFQHTLERFITNKRWEGLLFCFSFIKHTLSLLYASTALFFLLSISPFQDLAISSQSDQIIYNGWGLTLIVTITIGLALLLDFIMSLIATTNPKRFFQVCAPLTSLLLLIFAPFSIPFLKLLRKLLKKGQIEQYRSSSVRIRDKIMELLYDSDLATTLDEYDQHLILSVASFKERVAREVMIPRIDVFSLPSSTAIKEAAKLFYNTGYSRIPVYKDNVDHVIGVLLYKDVLNIYATRVDEENFGTLLNHPIEQMIKPVLYTPETKKISNLLQEFLKKQLHMAIVVDEYGGTEGIVTIEDILEELVGEIADEHDYDEEEYYTTLPSGEWIVDAKMSIIDIEKELGIHIEPNPEYDTVGGYIFHRAGSIPSKGWKIHHDQFDLEVLSSSDRAIEKIRITPQS